MSRRQCEVAEDIERKREKHTGASPATAACGEEETAAALTAPLSGQKEGSTGDFLPLPRVLPWQPRRINSASRSLDRS